MILIHPEDTGIWDNNPQGNIKISCINKTPIRLAIVGEGIPGPLELKKSMTKLWY